MPNTLALPALLIRLRPTGPWRIAGDSGRQDDLSPIFPSDRVFSAVTSVFAQSGAAEELDDWLAATARNPEPAVRFTSLFPFYGRQLFAPPPVTVWPPERASSKMNWQAARLVPLSVIDELLAGEPLREDRWEVDGLSGCLLPAGSQTPFRERLRSTAPVDRLNGASDAAYSAACLEFNQGVGLWGAIVFASESARDRWDPAVRLALRRLADSGFGAERSRGWGRSESPEFQAGSWPNLILENAAPPGAAEGGHWLLSSYIPAETDAVNLSTGFYELQRRNGRVESTAGWGAAKRSVNMIRAGGVIVAPAQPQGRAVDVAPDGFPHPVWRAGFAVSCPIPWKAPSFQLPAVPARVEAVRKPEPEAETALADIYLTDPIIVEEANIVEEAVVVEEPRYVDLDAAPEDAPQ